MPRDLDDLLAEGAPRDPGRPDLAAIESRAARRRTGRAGATVIALVAAIGIAFQSMPSQPDRPIIGDLEQTVEGATVLPLPDRGAVNADHANGRPVFVVHDTDGEVRVLDAISPLDIVPGGVPVLGYCTTSQQFVDVWYGATFGRNGAWAGGPSPHGLAEHEVLDISGDTVVVGSLLSAPERGALDAGEPAGRDCGDTSTEVRDEDFLLHVDVDDDRVAGLLYPERHPDPQPDGGLLVDDVPQVTTGGPVTLDLPPPGAVRALHVDGRPVFVHVAADDLRNVTVLDAVSPHDSWTWGQRVLAWCAPAPTDEDSPGVLVDLWYLSTFGVTSPAVANLAADTSREPTEWSGAAPAGAWGGGPAPTGLSRYPVLDVTLPTAAGDGSTGGTVTVAAGPLPARPRGGDTTGLGETCSDQVALFPDSPPADPMLRETLVVHEPEHPDRWWYPTPERLFGDDPGLPPEELDRYLDEIAPDRTEFTLDDLPSLGEAGFAVQTGLGVELLRLDGTSLGTIRDAELAYGDGRDGHGGAFLLRDADGTEHWVAPSNGTTMSAAGTTPSGYVEGEDGTWTSGDGFFPALQGPLHVGNAARHVTGPRCDDTDCPAPTVVDFDMGGTSTIEPGCVATDGFGDLNHLEVCTTFGGLEARSVVVGRFVDGEQRWEVPRYAGQPDDERTIGSFRDAVFGPNGVVAQLSLECEIPAVVLLQDDGSAADPWGADQWEGGPRSVLLGTTTALDTGGPVPLAQVAGGACGDAQGVEEGIWALTADGPELLNDVTDSVVLWTSMVTDLEAVARDIADIAEAADACTGAAGFEIDDVDLDGDGQLDRVLLDQDVVACLADGTTDRFASPPIEFAKVIGLGTGADALAVGGTLVSSSVAELLVWINHELTPVVVACTGSCIEPAERVGDVFEDGLLGAGQGSVTWGCRATSDGLEFLTVRAEHDEDQVTVTTVAHEFAGATLFELDRTVTTRTDVGTEFVALDHLGALGATRFCER